MATKPEDRNADQTRESILYATAAMKKFVAAVRQSRKNIYGR